MVRVEGSSASVKRVTLPVKCSPVACTCTSAESPILTFAASDSGTGMRRRSTSTCATVTTGRPLVLEVPACTSEPVSEKRQVTTPSYGAVMRGVVAQRGVVLLVGLARLPIAAWRRPARTWRRPPAPAKRGPWR